MTHDPPRLLLRCGCQIAFIDGDTPICPQHGPQAATTRESFEQEQWRVWREEVLFQLRRIHGELETARLRGWK